MARVKTFANSGTILPDDLNAIQDDYEQAYSTWKSVPHFHTTGGESTWTTTTGIYALTNSIVISATTWAWYAHRWDASGYRVPNRTTMLKSRVLVMHNTIDPGSFSIGVGLSSVTFPLTNPPQMTRVAKISGSEVVFNPLPLDLGGTGVNNLMASESGEFPELATGFYMWHADFQGTRPQGARLTISADLMMRHIG